MPAKQARRGPRATGRPETLAPTTAAQGRVSPPADRIRVHLWPRRGLSRSEEDQLASDLERSRADHHWIWAGAALLGDLWADTELTDTDLVDHLCALQSHADLVRIDLSQPHPSDHRPGAWLRVRRNHPELPSLCALYRDRLLTAASVIDALGGFVPSTLVETRPDDG